MADGRLAEVPDVSHAKVEMVQALRRASASLSDALAARNRIPTNQMSFFWKTAEEYKPILEKTEELIITDPHTARGVLCLMDSALMGTHRDQPPWRVKEARGEVEGYLGQMIDFVFGQPEHPRLAGPKQAMLWQLDPLLFIFLSFLPFPHKVGDWGYSASIWTDESKVEYLPYWIRVTKEHLQDYGQQMGYGWIFGKNFQMTIAKRAHLNYFADFRKSISQTRVWTL